ncbi:hypothetical protein NP493_240g05009 [Ridgeia piscesae]|uniref:Uncharacterized protein n=1 Tax=Ridgeia piscesae TaxID=27915 RepID=A0AAD9UDD6_RIDPI|nr:hypothetical protein NP493_240g05009 [Ridgeia piscesae]
MTEPMSLLPIARFHCSKLVLVGDPKQLSPTIQGSEAAHSQGLEQTLFDRLLLMGHQATMLHTQYRCHPDISAIANELFYERQLKDGITIHDRPALASDWPAVCFYDVANGNEQSQNDNSFYNVAEAEFVVSLIQVLVHHHDIDPRDIGVITLYRAQVAAILQRLQAMRAGGDRQEPGIQVSTVDAFQGGERPIIILSCVLTHSQSFLDSDKRTNVALTRAKNHLFIVGNHGNLVKNKLWCHVIQYCQGRCPNINCLTMSIPCMYRPHM